MPRFPGRGILEFCLQLPTAPVGGIFPDEKVGPGSLVCFPVGKEQPWAAAFN